MWRAEHLLWDDPAKIFEDTLALRLCGCENATALRAQVDRLAVEIAESQSRFLNCSSHRSGFRERSVKPFSVALPNSFSSTQTTAFFSRR
jgi:hypothetical protein